MSYILDALKKSDRERQDETSPHLQPLFEKPPQTTDAGALHKSRWVFLLLCGLLLVGGWLRWPEGITGPSGKGQPPGQEAPRMTAAPPDVAAPVDVAGQAPSPTPADAAGEKLPAAITVQAEWFDDWLQHLPGRDTQIALGSSGPAAEVAGAADRPAAAIVAPPTQTVKPVKIRKERGKVLLAAPAVIDQPPQVEPVVGQPGPAPADPPGKQRSGLPYLRDLPPQVQTEIPRLQFAGHAYAEIPAQRLIIVNGMIMREGDQIDGETRLAEITWEGVVIERKGVRFQVRCY